MAHIEYLASELLVQIYDSLEQVQDVLALGATCHRLHAVAKSGHQLRFLEGAAHRQYGPLHDAAQVLTQNESQPAHIARPIKISMALMKDIVKIGMIANKWADIYPFKKWKDNYQDRRLLSENERFRVRRAVYRVWLYGAAFHTPSTSREGRLLPHVMRPRAELLHNWDAQELAEVADIREIIRQVLVSNVCPSNSTVSRKFRQRHGDDAVKQLVFNMTTIHLNFPPPEAPPPCPRPGHFAAPPPSDMFYQSSTFATQTTRAKSYHLGRYGADAGSEGWGDNLAHHYIIEDMLKLDPSQILWLKESKLPRAQVLEWTRSLGDWFENYGDTFGETLAYVLCERGEQLSDFDTECGCLDSESDSDED